MPVRSKQEKHIKKILDKKNEIEQLKKDYEDKLKQLEKELCDTENLYARTFQIGERCYVKNGNKYNAIRITGLAFDNVKKYEYGDKISNKLDIQYTYEHLMWTDKDGIYGQICDDITSLYHYCPKE